jgi:hypothetical protein
MISVNEAGALKPAAAVARLGRLAGDLHSCWPSPTAG